MEERGGLTGGGVGLGVAGVWGVCGVVGVCGVWGLWEDGLTGLAFGGLGMLEGGKLGGELVCRATMECCLTGAGALAGVVEEGLVMEWMSLAGLGAVGGGTGLGETGGGIFFPSTIEREKRHVKMSNCDPHPHLTNTQVYNVSTWTSRCPRTRQGDSLVGDRVWGGLWAPLSLYLCHGRFWGDRRLWFSHRTSFIAHWSTLVQTVPTRSSSHLRLRLRLWLWLRLRLILGLGLRLRLRLRLLRHSGIRHRAALHGGRAVLVGDWLHGVWLPGPRGLSVSCGHVCVAVGLLVTALGPPFDGG